MHTVRHLNEPPFSIMYTGRDRRPYTVCIDDKVAIRTRTWRGACRWVRVRQSVRARLPVALGDDTGDIWTLSYDVHRTMPEMYPRDGAFKLTRGNESYRYNTEREARRAHRRLTGRRGPPWLITSLLRSLAHELLGWG